MVIAKVEEMQGQQEQQEQLTFEQGLKQQETQAKLEERGLKLEQQMTQKNQKFEQDAELSQARAVSEIQTKNALTANQVANENRKSRSKETDSQ